MTDTARKNLEGCIASKRASLTPVEAAFLHALLIDPPTKKTEGDDNDDDNTTHDKAMESAARKLSDSMLFQVVVDDDDDDDEQPSLENNKQQQLSERPEHTRDNRTFGDLWKAFEDGVSSKRLLKVLQHTSVGAERRKSKSFRKKKVKDDEKEVTNNETQADDVNDDDDDDTESIRSDVEVRVDKAQYEKDMEDMSDSGSSWDEGEGGFDHFDAWEVLKDEYAKDFGFHYEHKSSEEELLADESEDDSNHFLILGTSASDTSATPHVMSPPLMDALMTFLPDVLHNQNYWLKYSLLRDGASFETFKRYIRGSQQTILALETADGHVFGSFTTCPWRTHPHFYGGGMAGGGQSFLWKMRHSRNQKCYSLVEQAQMENEVDVYMYSGENDMIQLCTSDMIAVGGGALKRREDNDDDEQQTKNSSSSREEEEDDAAAVGFGLAIDDDLLHGSTSPCATYRNPCLLNHSKRGEPFKVVNLEVWTLTPCVTVDSAEKLELTKFFIEDSQQHMMHTSSGPDIYLTSNELKQEEFFRRVGHNEGESAQRRDRWQRENMMGGFIL